MKARISEELEKLINEKIYLDLEIHLLSKKIEKATQTNDQKQKIWLEGLLDKRLKSVRVANETLRKQNVKIQQPIHDDMFVQYDFYVKENGGYKEGNFRYRKDAVKYTLNKRLNG